MGQHLLWSLTHPSNAQFNLWKKFPHRKESNVKHRGTCRRGAFHVIFVQSHPRSFDWQIYQQNVLRKGNKPSNMRGFDLILTILFPLEGISMKSKICTLRMIPYPDLKLLQKYFWNKYLCNHAGLVSALKRTNQRPQIWRLWPCGF